MEAWLAADKWDKLPVREALPPPLSIVARLELAMGNCPDEDVWVVGAILLMVWAGLRWSDVQRLKFSSLVIDAESLRAWTWRSKTSVFGIPFGALFCGVTGVQWGERTLGRAFIICETGAASGALCLTRACLPNLGGAWLCTARWLRQTFVASRCTHVRRPHYHGRRSLAFGRSGGLLKAITV